MNDNGAYDRLSGKAKEVAGKVTDAATANEHDGVLLKVMALAGNVGRDLEAVDEAHAGNLA